MSATPEFRAKEATVFKGHEVVVLAARFNGDGNYGLTVSLAARIEPKKESLI